MISRQRIPFRLRFKMVLPVLVALLVVQPQALASDQIKPDAITEYNEEKSISVVKIDPPETFSNAYEISDSGGLAKDKAA